MTLGPSLRRAFCVSLVAALLTVTGVKSQCLPTGDWGDWGAWGKCAPGWYNSTSGVSTRIRTCVALPVGCIQTGSISCPGNYSQVQWCAYTTTTTTTSTTTTLPTTASTTTTIRTTTVRATTTRPTTVMATTSVQMTSTVDPTTTEEFDTTVRSTVEASTEAATDATTTDDPTTDAATDATMTGDTEEATAATTQEATDATSEAASEGTTDAGSTEEPTDATSEATVAATSDVVTTSKPIETTLDPTTAETTLIAETTAHQTNQPTESPIDPTTVPSETTPAIETTPAPTSKTTEPPIDPKTDEAKTRSEEDTTRAVTSTSIDGPPLSTTTQAENSPTGEIVDASTNKHTESPFDSTTVASDTTPEAWTSPSPSNKPTEASVDPSSAPAETTPDGETTLATTDDPSTAAVETSSVSETDETSTNPTPPVDPSTASAEITSDTGTDVASTSKPTQLTTAVTDGADTTIITSTEQMLSPTPADSSTELETAPPEATTIPPTTEASETYPDIETTLKPTNPPLSTLDTSEAATNGVGTSENPTTQPQKSTDEGSAATDDSTTTMQSTNLPVATTEAPTTSGDFDTTQPPTNPPLATSEPPSATTTEDSDNSSSNPPPTPVDPLTTVQPAVGSTTDVATETTTGEEEETGPTEPQPSSSCQQCANLQQLPVRAGDGRAISVVDHSFPTEGACRLAEVTCVARDDETAVIENDSGTTLASGHLPVKARARCNNQAAWSVNGQILSGYRCFSRAVPDSGATDSTEVTEDVTESVTATEETTTKAGTTLSTVPAPVCTTCSNLPVDFTTSMRDGTTILDHRIKGGCSLVSISCYDPEGLSNATLSYNMSPNDVLSEGIRANASLRCDRTGKWREPTKNDEVAGVTCSVASKCGACSDLQITMLAQVNRSLEDASSVLNMYTLDDCDHAIFTCRPSEATSSRLVRAIFNGGQRGEAPTASYTSSISCSYDGVWVETGTSKTIDSISCIYQALPPTTTTSSTTTRPQTTTTSTSTTTTMPTSTTMFPGIDPSNPCMNCSHLMVSVPGQREGATTCQHKLDKCLTVAVYCQPQQKGDTVDFFVNGQSLGWRGATFNRTFDCNLKSQWVDQASGTVIDNVACTVVESATTIRQREPTTPMPEITVTSQTITIVETDGTTSGGETEMSESPTDGTFETVTGMSREATTEEATEETEAGESTTVSAGGGSTEAATDGTTEVTEESTDLPSSVNTTRTVTVTVPVTTSTSSTSSATPTSTTTRGPVSSITVPVITLPVITTTSTTSSTTTSTTTSAPTTSTTTIRTTTTTRLPSSTTTVMREQPDTTLAISSTTSTLPPTTTTAPRTTTTVFSGQCGSCPNLVAAPLTNLAANEYNGMLVLDHSFSNSTICRTVSVECIANSNSHAAAILVNGAIGLRQANGQVTSRLACSSNGQWSTILPGTETSFTVTSASCRATITASGSTTTTTLQPNAPSTTTTTMAPTTTTTAVGALRCSTCADLEVIRIDQTGFANGLSTIVRGVDGSGCRTADFTCNTIQAGDTAVVFNGPTTIMAKNPTIQNIALTCSNQATWMVATTTVTQIGCAYEQQTANPPTTPSTSTSTSTSTTTTAPTTTSTTPTTPTTTPTTTTTTTRAPSTSTTTTLAPTTPSTSTTTLAPTTTTTTTTRAPSTSTTTLATTTTTTTLAPTTTTTLAPTTSTTLAPTTTTSTSTSTTTTTTAPTTTTSSTSTSTTTTLAPTTSTTTGPSSTTSVSTANPALCDSCANIKASALPSIADNQYYGILVVDHFIAIDSCRVVIIRCRAQNPLDTATIVLNGATTAATAVSQVSSSLTCNNQGQFLRLAVQITSASCVVTRNAAGLTPTPGITTTTLSTPTTTAPGSAACGNCDRASVASSATDYTAGFLTLDYRYVGQCIVVTMICEPMTTGQSVSLINHDGTTLATQAGSLTTSLTCSDTGVWVVEGTPITVSGMRCTIVQPPSSTTTTTTLAPNPGDCATTLWADWHEWSSCSDSCGACGTHQRFRACQKPVAGSSCTCAGSAYEKGFCNMDVCRYPRPSSCCNGYTPFSETTTGRFVCAPTRR